MFKRTYSKSHKTGSSTLGEISIIDFPLSNCANSGIDIVGVLTQYESVLLGTYVGAGTNGDRWS